MALAEVAVPVMAGLLSLLTEVLALIFGLVRWVVRRAVAAERRGEPGGVRPEGQAQLPVVAPASVESGPDSPPPEAAAADAAPAPSPPPPEAAVADAAPAPSPPRPEAQRWRWLALVGVALLATLWVVDRVLLSVVAERAAATLAEERGFVVEWDRLDGHLLTGEVTVEGLRISRPAHPRSVVDLRVARVEADVAVFSFFGSDPIVIERAAVQGLDGTLERTGPRQPRPDSRGFDVRALSLSGVDVRVGDRTGAVPIGARVQVERVDVRPFRRAMTAFDLFFHAAGDGTIDGHPFSARQTATGGRLSFDDLPGELVADWIGGPLTWLQSAPIDLEVVYSAPTAADVGHRFAFEVHLDGLRLAAPPAPSLRWRLATKPVRMWLEGREPTLTLTFESRVDEAELARSGRSPSRLFARLARSTLTEALAQKAGLAADVLLTIGEAVRAMRR